MTTASIWGNKFTITAIIQGAIITDLSLLIVAIQLLFSSAVNIIQFLSLSFEGPAKWFFLGYIFYIILVVAIAVTAIFYNHLEINMGKNQRIEGWASLDSSDWNECRWYCYDTNHVYAGLIGSGIFSLISNGGSSSAVAGLTSKSCGHGTIYSPYRYICRIT